MPALLRAIRKEAPGVVLVIKQVNYWNISELLMSGEVTVGVCLTRELPANAKRKLLRSIQPMVVRADKSAKPMTLDEYCSRPHVVVSHVANISSFADEWLDAIGRKRKAVLSVPQYSTLPALMAGTDLLCNLPDHLTQAMINTGMLYGEPLPFITPNLELSMTWLSIMDTDPAERWLRKRLEEFMGDRDRVSPIL
jgi:LysR family transcriptional activator of mexEF-oprN operon